MLFDMHSEQSLKRLDSMTTTALETE